MKRYFTILAVLFVLFGAVGCSKKTYDYEDYEIMQFVEELQNLKEEANETDGVNLDYEFNKGYDNKYSFVITIEFDGHKAEIKSNSFTFEEIKDGFSNYEVDEILNCKIDGVKYDVKTFEVLMNHYSEGNFGF